MSLWIDLAIMSHHGTVGLPIVLWVGTYTTGQLLTSGLGGKQEVALTTRKLVPTCHRISRAAVTGDSTGEVAP